MSPGSKIALALFVLGLITYLPYHVVKHDSTAEYERMLGEVEQMRADNQALRLDNQRRERHIRSLNEHPILLERYARERLMLAKPDETILIFPEQPPALHEDDAAPKTKGSRGDDSTSTVAEPR